ncbi:MAG: DegT/DnrJ/EryC1/StrS family aminotransferase, partial [Pirellulaceae bacterium]|nr:DegT/DnrJ/EryC1/StrS family aminotransferase [Pirellulaceae bacterium]
CADRDNVIRKLDQAEIGWGIHYPLPIHLMDAYQSLGYERGDLPITEATANHILSLPIFPELGEANLQQIIQALCL